MDTGCLTTFVDFTFAYFEPGTDTVVITATLDKERGRDSLSFTCERAGVGCIAVLAYNPTEHGSVKTVNAGLRLALELDTEYIAFVNDDARPPEKWLAQMIEVLKSNPKFGLVVTSGMCRSTPQKATEPRPAATVVLTRPPALFCTVVKREVFGKLGLFDEAYIHYAADSDFGKQVARAGWQCVLARGIFVEHSVGHYERETEWRNHDFAIYKERWG